MKTKLSLLGACAFVALNISAAEAAAPVGWYLGLEGGGNWIEDVDGKLVTAGGTVSSSTDEFDNGWAALASFGYGVNHWQFEFEGGYRNNEFASSSGAELTIWSLMANVIYDFQLSRQIDVNLGAGAGGAYANLESTSSVYDDGEWNFAAQAIAGLNFTLSQHWAVTLKYRYLRVFEPEFDGFSYYVSPSLYPATLEYDDIVNHTVTLGLRYEFGEAEVAPPPMPTAAEPPPPPPEVPREYIVFFGHNQSDLTQEAMDVVRQAASAAKQYGSATITVVGHADRSGSAKYNDKLSMKRATKVKGALVAEGIAEGAISVSAKGESDPLVVTADGVREPQNRRVHISL